ncbi:olfactory receptor class A-like protein 1 [Pleurodeles waltl]
MAYISLLLLALLANSLLLLCFYGERGLSANDWILVNLSVANILSSVTRNVFACLTIFGVKGLCQVDLFFLAIALYLTAYCNCFLSLNQTLQVLKFKSTWVMRQTLRLRQHLTLTLVSIWGLCMLPAIHVAASTNFYTNTTSRDRRTVLGKCTLPIGLVSKVSHIVLGDVIPLTIFLGSSLILIQKLWKHKRQIQAAGLAQAGWRNAKEKRATKTVLMLLAFYMSVWGCNYALGFVRDSPSVWEPKVITKTAYAIISALIIIQGSSKMRAKVLKVLQICPPYPSR